MKRYTCIVCPKSCEIEVSWSSAGDFEINGNGCQRGREWITNEIRDPKRTIASSVIVEGGEREIVSVRLSSPIPRAMIFPVMDEIRKASVSAPVTAGDVIIENVLSTGADVIATSSVLAKED